VEPSKHSLHSRLHSADLAHESTYVHSCSEQLSASIPPASPDSIPASLVPNTVGPHFSQQSPGPTLPSAFPP
jgi:hypothetical protein